jgi:hypothetical protein
MIRGGLKPSCAFTQRLTATAFSAVTAVFHGRSFTRRVTDSSLGFDHGFYGVRMTGNKICDARESER